MADKVSYALTPDVSNYVINSRASASITTTNVTLSPKNAASFDDTFNLTKCTATGATPSVSRTSTGTLQLQRVSASVWLKADTTLPPGTITLTLTDAAGGQSVSSTINNNGTVQRYGLCGYFSNASTGCKLTVSWASITGIIWVDAWQIENNDWPSEYIDNPTSGVLARTVFADPERFKWIIPYLYNTRLTWDNLFWLDNSIFPQDHIATLNTLFKYYSVRGHQLNLDNVAAGTHLMYRAKKKPPIYANDTDVVDIPPPDVFTLLVYGGVAYQKAALYDIGTNAEAASAMKEFQNRVEMSIMTNVEHPAWSYVDVVVGSMR